MPEDTRHPLKLLILGGTGEAMELARALEDDARYDPVYSVAGRTSNPRLPDLRCRTGGFGGVPGLVEWIRAEGTHIIIDATHPFAARISANAAAAADQAGCKLLALRRPAWTPEPEDHWRSVPHMAAAAQALGETPKRVLLTIGQLELAAFCQAPQHHYITRSVELPETRPPHCLCLTQRGPFQLEDELTLLSEHHIDTLVTKNSGGEATQAKLQAARQCGVEVIMVERPAVPRANHETATPQAALALLHQFSAGR
ncbi:cobalt-precorrin-6A reductase [Ectothiorhodospira variabilis]|uniref:cobalt-precorrin-6A reductase n=1 Tax=Ectothiorhodospira variabilis TaxID=505694 RepID=UPI001EFBAE6C|nr:cobalt-precorrin-6A reductase [Ectothiorhodospira variabilis]MCG5494960.1 cobalt-precorrin-6A reductase [Ectothiorhodospira variabilis]MCG5504473.1 cobalt-precorrin-6A reductase [Ectothiorhodospira variabilis]MCG5507661.1 cobalt-precorrin-6A reductase [Ectothiorhodospira variabilis]